MHLLLKAVTVLSIFIAVTANAQSSSLNGDIDRFVNMTMKRLQIKSATAIAVVKNDKIIYQNTFGLADIERDYAASNDTLFYIASITKPMFSLTLMQSLAQSRYTLDYTLAEMFPDIEFHAGILASKITIADLLSHTSGLNDKYLASAVSTSGLHTPESKIAMLAALTPDPDYTHGQFNYTNLGYNILSIWYEKTFGQSWQKATQQLLFSPLKMQRSTASVSLAKKQGWQLAQPYSFFSVHADQALYLQKQDNTMHAGGGIYSPIGDMAKFLTVQLNHEKTASSEQIPAKLVEQSHQIRAIVDSKHGDFKRDGYALGWYTGQYKNQNTYHHFGAFDGFRPHMSFMPDKNIGIVILNNEGILNDKLTDLFADFIYSKLLNEQDVAVRLEQRVTKLSTNATLYRDKFVKKEVAYETLPLSLTLENQQYAGTYTHPLAGEISVNLKEDNFHISWGNLHAKATAFRKPDMLRVKLRPTSARVMKFKVINAAVTALDYAGVTFTKSTIKNQQLTADTTNR